MMRCTNCHYADDVIVDARKGRIGIECRRDNMRFIPEDIADTMHCGAWAEREDE